MADRAEGSEGWSASTCKQVAHRSLIDVRLLCQIPVRPAAQDSGSLYGLDVDRPFETGGTALQRRLAAMEGTVLRVPCIPLKRGRVFWRSSVRGPGPPAANGSRFSDRRRRAWGDCLANDSTVLSLWQHSDPFALRVARPSARTRGGPSIANCSTGVRVEPSPTVGNAGEASAPIPVLAANIGDIALNNTSDRRNF